LAHGERIKKTEWSDDSQEYITITYVYSGLNVIYEETTTGEALYIYGPSGRVAKQITVNNETTVFYYHTDHLGYTRLITDENGTPVTSVEYSPFGMPDCAGSSESYLFTGKEQDLTGLYYFNARYYSPETGRLITRAPYTFLPDDPRAVNNSSEDTAK
jgi:RHS repeat-associated protein